MSQILSGIGNSLRTMITGMDREEQQAVDNHVLPAAPMDVANNAQPYYIPPVGEIGDNDKAKVFAYLEQLALESDELRSEWVAQADSNEVIYAYGNDPIPDDEKVQSNEIQNSIVAIVDLQTKEPPRAKISPIETGETPTYYWTGPNVQPQPILDPMSGMAIQQPAMFGLTPDMMGQWVDESGKVNPPNPMTLEQGEAAEAAVRGGVIPDRYLAVVNDKFRADTAQKVFDVIWTRSGIDRRNRAGQLANNVHGWHWDYYHWDKARKRCELIPLSVKQVHIDPTVEDIDDAMYANADLYLDAAKARVMFPEIAGVIDTYANVGTPRSQSVTMLIPQAYNRYFRRPMIVLRVWWLRNSLMKMSVEEAMEAGLVTHGQRTILVDGVQNGTENETGIGGESGGAVDETATGDDGQQLAPAPVQTPVVQTYLADARTGQEVDISSANWPMKSVLRRIISLPCTGDIVDDRECEDWDIPLIHNRNIPVPGKPYGQGEPFRQKRIQLGQTLALTAMVEHLQYFAHPVSTMSQSMRDALVNAYGDAYTKPGMVISVPDDQWLATQGRIDSIINPPPMSESVIRVNEVLRQTQREDSGYTDSLRGLAATTNESGRAAALRQESASGLIGYKAQQFGECVYRLSRLIIHSIHYHMQLEDVCNIVQQYPPFVLAAVFDKNRQSEWDIDVTVSTGTQQIQQMKKQDALADLQTGAITMETYRDTVGIDNQAEEQKMRRQAEEMAAMQPQQPAPKQENNGA